MNVGGTTNLLTGLEQSGYLPMHFIFISSVAIYGNEEEVLIDEQSYRRC